MCRVDPQAGEPGPCIVRARGAREHEKDAQTCWWLPHTYKGWGGMVLTACCLGRLGLSAGGGVWSRGGLRDIPYHTPQKEFSALP